MGAIFRQINDIEGKVVMGHRNTNKVLISALGIYT